MEKFYKEIIEYINKKKPGKKELTRKKYELAKKYKLKSIPTNIQISMHSKEKLHLKTKPSRTLSGVNVVAIMTSPAPCPHGKCITCPGGPKSEFGETPQSYTGQEPAARRGARNNFDPYLQVFNRLEQYVVLGNIPQKIELIVMGGTFLAREKKYRTEFIKYAFKAMNDFSKMFFRDGKFKIEKFKQFFELPEELSDKRTQRMIKKILKIKGKCDLKKEQEYNDKKSKVKCVGLTIETRPDWIDGNEMLRLGATRVELGVQSTKEKALTAMGRGHTAQQNIDAIKYLKNLGFKLNFHIMPGLPGMTLKDDKKMMEELFENPNYRPDMIKIYPTLVVKGTVLYDMWEQKKYKPMTTEKASKLISDFLKKIPKYCRLMRVQRDMPSNVVDAGVDRTNLRQYVDKHLTKKEIFNLNEIRARESGLKEKLFGVKPKKTELEIVEYEASEGKEYFISIVDKKQNILLGFCRLRIPKNIKTNRQEINKKSALIRELHVYGEVEKITEKGKQGKTQHKGIGKKLMQKAEEIAKKEHKNKVIVISGVGVRQYYRKIGYRLEGAYMVKHIR